MVFSPDLAVLAVDRSAAHSALFWLALLTLLLWLVVTVESGRGTRRLRELPDLPLLDPTRAPGVSVVIAARNEERNLEEALQSVLRQSYPRLEVLVVDDRSTDATPEILDRMAAADPRLRVLHLRELPTGWLGKNHALERGAEAAAGEWLLFTDADVVLHPTALQRAVGYALAEGMDHLAVAPELRVPGTLLDVLVGTFAVYFARYARPWKARDPRSSAHVGIGAFNLLRAEAYRAVGGHRPIAMRPDDDLKLGKVIKRHGFRQDVLFGRHMVHVEWYRSVREMVHGLEKNSFAGMNYSVVQVLLATLVAVLVDVWPFVAVVATAGPTRLLNVATALLAMATYAASTRASGSRPWLAPAYPLASLLILYIVLRSTLLALRNGGIRWRDTHYPLDQLRANRV